MERFIRRENVRHYRELLKTVKDEAQHQKILNVLAEEQQKQIDAVIASFRSQDLDSILAVANFALHLDFSQSAYNPFGVPMAARKAKGGAPMAMQSKHHDHWIHGNAEERGLILAIMAMIAMSPIVMWWFYG
jgi:hypothetical protein